MSAAVGVPRLGTWLMVLGLTATTGCIDAVLVPGDPPDDPPANFEQLWTEVDRYYSFFDQKGIDWDALYQQYRPRVTASTSDSDLFQIMAELLDHLQDGHVNLWAPFGHYQYTGWYDRYPENYDQVLARAQLTGTGRSGPLEYGRLTPEIGYVYIPSFDPSRTGDMDRALDALSGVEALVLDVRDNGGGSTDALPEIIGPFADKRRVYARHQYRDGPHHSDFSRLFDDVVGPRGPHFAGPVAVLTNRRCFSTTEDFLLGVRVIPTMFTVGDTTGGGQGNPILRELPNGWVFRVSRWRMFLPDGTPLRDGEGLPPDYPVQLSQQDADRGVDTIIARAIALLQERLTGG